MALDVYCKTCVIYNDLFVQRIIARPEWREINAVNVTKCNVHSTRTVILTCVVTRTLDGYHAGALRFVHPRVH